MTYLIGDVKKHGAFSMVREANISSQITIQLGAMLPSGISRTKSLTTSHYGTTDEIILCSEWPLLTLSKHLKSR